MLKKDCVIKTMIFPLVIYRCEIWTIEKTECQRIDAFELWCWGRLLRVPWSARRSNQSIQRKSTLNIHWKLWCWSWNSNTLATWFEELNLWKRPWCWERLRAGVEWGDRGWDGWWHHQYGGHESEKTLGDSERQRSLAGCSPWDHRVWHDLVTEQQHDFWLPIAYIVFFPSFNADCVTDSWSMSCVPHKFVSFLKAEACLCYAVS